MSSLYEVSFRCLLYDGVRWLKFTTRNNIYNTGITLLSCVLHIEIQLETSFFNTLHFINVKGVHDLCV